MEQSGTLTYDDLLAFPDDGLRRELIDGELIVSPAPRLRHQDVVGRLFLALGGFVSQHGGGRVYLGPVDILFSGSNVVEPDLIFVGQDQLDILTDANIQGVPRLVIEVLSNPRLDRIRKRDLYERFGVPEYWIVDPDADRVEVYRLQDERYGKPVIVEPGETLTLDALPGFTLDVASLFLP